MSGEPNDQDGEMAAQLKRGDATAIESLYDRYGRLAYGLALRILNDRNAAEDVVQDAFLGVWRNAGSFDGSRGSLRNWLLSVVHNRAIDRLRGTAKTPQEAQLETIERTAGMPGPRETVAPDLERKQILEAFQQLPEAQPLAPELAHFRRYPHTELSPHLHLPPGA